MRNGAERTSDCRSFLMRNSARRTPDCRSFVMRNGVVLQIEGANADAAIVIELAKRFIDGDDIINVALGSP
jgi:mRNA degradation ribonuclease J1/J2